MKKKIYLFSHNYLINNWKEILENQLKLIKSSGLYNEMTNMYLLAYGEDRWKDLMKIVRLYDVDNKIITLSIDENFYEYPTLQKLYKFAKNIENSHILYFHLKGVWSSLDTTRNNEAIVSWRKCLEYFNIEKWKDCVNKLDEGHEVVGALYNYNETEPLFSGNFWWTTSDYIKKLKYPEYDSSKNPYFGTPEDDGTWCRVECEKWINTIPNKFYNFYIPKDYGFYYVPIDEKDYKKDIDDLMNKYRIFFLDDCNGVNRLFGLKDLIEETINKNSIVCEIGSFGGISSELFALNCKELHCVDLWDDFWTQEGLQKDINIPIAEKNFDNMMKKYNHIKKIKKFSEEASKDYENEYFDLIYIDASHDYESVKNDIINWIPKIKKIGFISGHDYISNETYNVKKAVDEIFTNIPMKIYSDSSWCIKMENYYNKEKYKISIIIPTYNRENALTECINSVINQNYKNIEILVCHDGHWKKKFDYNDNRIHIYNTENKENKYGTQQRNFLLNKVTGNFVVYLDDDNILYDNYLNKMIQQIDDNTGMIVCRIHFNDKEWNNLVLPPTNELISTKIDSLNVMIRSDVAKKFQWDNYDIGHDHRYINNCEKLCNELGLKIKFIPDVLANHRFLNRVNEFLKEDDNGVKKEVVIMTAHPNFKTSEDITKLAIQSFSDRDIILSTHCPVSVELQKMVKYFLYDKNNPLIRHDYYDQSWFNTDEYYALIKLHKNDNDLQHALAVYINYFNAVMYAKSLGYTTCICTNFDIVFSTEDLNTIDNKVKEMYQTDKKSFFMTSDATEGIHYKTIFFITDVNFFLDNFKYVTNENDYNKLTREIGSETNCLENFFYQTLKNSDKLLLQQISENDLFSSSLVNVFSNIEYFTILPLRNDDNHFVVWFSSANSIDNRYIKIDIQKNGETIFNHSENLTQNYNFYKEIKFEKGCNYEIICSINYTDAVNQKIIVVNDEIFSKIKEYGDFWKK